MYNRDSMDSHAKKSEHLTAYQYGAYQYSKIPRLYLMRLSQAIFEEFQQAILL
jgi:hypothetical protein